MIITILAEPRSGSTNLANWFKLYKNFTVLQEPLNKNVINNEKRKLINKNIYNTEHSLIKEIYLPNTDLTELINISDKIILLYRENIIEQLESWLVAFETKKWTSEWDGNRVEITNKKDKENFFYSLKDKFQNEYLSNSDFFKISYEELYYKEGFKKIVDYLDLECIKNENFPYGKKYKINSLINKLI